MERQPARPATIWRRVLLLIGASASACSLLNPLDGLAVVTDGDASRAGDDGAPDGPPTSSLRDATSEEAAAAPPSYRETVLQDRPIGYWRLGDRTLNGPAHDEMGTHDGTYRSGVSLEATGAIIGDTDTAITVDGVHGEVVVDTAGFGFEGRSGFSLEAWIKPSVIDSTYRRIITNEGADSAGRQGWAFWLFGGGSNPPGIGLERYQDDKQDHALTPALPALGVWTHVVASYDGMSIALYVDGQRSALQASTGSMLDQKHLRFGSANTDSQFFAGGLDEIAIYDRPLDPARIAAHHAVGTGAR
jgi:hypothetical protein